MVNPDVDCYIETLNQQKYSKKRKNKLLKTKRILTLRYKPNGALSFAFTVACRRRKFVPPEGARRPKHVKICH